MQYLRGAFEQRSKEVIQEVDYLIFIHDGISKGTKNEFALYKQTGKPYHYEVLKPTEFDRSVGFNIKKDWTFDFNEEKDNDIDLTIDLNKY